MIRLIAAELFKLRTTRAFYSLAGGALGFTLLIIGLGAIFDDGEMRLNDVMMIAFFAQLIVLVIGILCITNEFRHGTITPTLLVSPDRVQLVLAKVVASLLIGLVLGLLACGIIAAVVAISGGETDDALAVIVGGALLAGLYAVARRRDRGDHPQPGRRDHRRARLHPAGRGAGRADPRHRRGAAGLRAGRDITVTSRDRHRRHGHRLPGAAPGRPAAGRLRRRVRRRRDHGDAEARRHCLMRLRPATAADAAVATELIIAVDIDQIGEADYSLEDAPRRVE